MATIDLNPEIVCNIILKAREFHAKEGVVIPEKDPRDPTDVAHEDWAYQVLADHANDLIYIELKKAIAQLEPDQQATLVAMMWLGRGDYEVDEWGTMLEVAESRLTERTADYLLATPLVADYLEAGLNALGYSCEDIVPDTV